MSINSTLRKEGIEDIRPLGTLEINKIASNISEKISTAFPEHNINQSNLFMAIARLNMFTAKMPQDHSAAKYFYKNNSIYFSNDINYDDISTIAIHESIHYIQEIRNKSGKRLLRMGLHQMSNGNSGIAINEAAVQLMASIANNSKIDSVKYYDLDIKTESPNYYPIECALIKQMLFFTGSYALFHSTLYADDIFKNTFIAKTNSKVYKKIVYNFDQLFHYQSLLNTEMVSLMHLNDNDITRINYINLKISNIKKLISKITLETQELIVSTCFYSELDLVRDKDSIKTLKSRLDSFKEILISSKNYSFYDNFYKNIMLSLEQKEKLIEEHGILNYTESSLNALVPESKVFSITFIRNMYVKLKLLFETYGIIRKED